MTLAVLGGGVRIAVAVDHQVGQVGHLDQRRLTHRCVQLAQVALEVNLCLADITGLLAGYSQLIASAMAACPLLSAGPRCRTLLLGHEDGAIFMAPEPGGARTHALMEGWARSRLAVRVTESLARLGARCKVERHAGLVAHDPRVVAGRRLEGVARPDFDLHTIRSAYDHPARDDVADVTFRLLASQRPHMCGPPPTWLVHAAANDNRR